MSRGHVLIVDDNDDVANGLREVLEGEGYEVTRVANGRQALFILDGKLRPSVIVLDMMMPIMSGAEFRREQLERHAGVASIPVIGWTAYDHISADFEVIRKGGPTADLLARIRELAQSPGVTPSKRRMSTRRLSVIAAIVTGAVGIALKLLDHFFPPKGRP